MNDWILLEVRPWGHKWRTLRVKTAIEAIGLCSSYCCRNHQFVSSSLSTLTSAPHWLYWVIRVLAGSYVDFDGTSTPRPINCIVHILYR
ncbi:hypothetical protein Scep_020563 [Stephania cephalantha]|uniref:Uncharacterized protein n=1 Tax=Stephania cephalantha TaxID=152367 RepID=A0AAP0ICU4_9MAGN